MGYIFDLALFDGGEATGGVTPSADAGQSKGPMTEQARFESWKAKKTAQPAQTMQLQADTPPTNTEGSHPDQQETPKTTPVQKTPDEEFAELINGKYKAQHQALFNKRFGEYKGLQEFQAKHKDTMKTLGPMLDEISLHYGVDRADLPALVNAFKGDTSRYEGRAEKNGVTVEVQKQLDEAAMIRQESLRIEQERRNEEQARRFNMAVEARKEKEVPIAQAKYPGFDFDAEMANEDQTFAFHFFRGTPADEAYFLAHAKEIHQAELQRVKVEAEADAQKKALEAVRTNKSRPLENGMGGSVPTTTRIDIRNSTREQREQWAKEGRLPGR